MRHDLAYGATSRRAVRGFPKIAWLTFILAAAVASWAGAVWAVEFLVHASRLGG